MTQNNSDTLHMWRCVVAMAHADGIMCDEECTYLEELFSTMKNASNLSEEHYQTLMDDLDTAPDAAEMLSLIEEPELRGQAIYFARLLAYKDGEFHPNEEALLEKMNLSATQNIDVEALRTEVREHAATQRALRESEMEELRAQTGVLPFFGRAITGFGKRT